MTTARVGLVPRASTASVFYESDLNPYWNSSSSAPTSSNNNNYHGLYSSSNGSSSSTVIDDLIEIPTEDANNVLSNETVVIYQYDGGARNQTVIGGGGAAIGGGFVGGQEVDWERERIRSEFYATYDVMTGLRIAGTLAAFFGLMVMLVMYKSRRRVKDPKIAAVAAEMVQEEEDRELQEAFDTLEAAGIFPELDTLPYRERRLLSLGNISAPPMLNYSPRFSSVGGGSCSLWDPPTRLPASHPLPFPPSSPTGNSRREAFRSSRNSSSDRSQCVSFDMSEMGRRRSDTRAWMGRRATFQSVQSDSLKCRNKVFLSNTRQGRDANRIKLIRLYTTSSSREEDVEEVIEHGLLTEEEAAAAAAKVALPVQAEEEEAAAPADGRQQSTSTASFIVSSVDYQDSDLRSVGSESMFSERYADTDDEEDDREKEGGSSDDSEEDASVAVARLKSGAYQKLQRKRIAARIDNCTIATYEAPSCSKARTPPPAVPRRLSVAAASSYNTRTTPATGTRPKSLLESRTFELHSLVPKSQSSTGGAFGGLNSREMFHELLRRREHQERQQKGGGGGGLNSTTKWSKETLF